jgi:hypothetical protein
MFNMITSKDDIAKYATGRGKCSLVLKSKTNPDSPVSTQYIKRWSIELPANKSNKVEVKLSNVLTKGIASADHIRIASSSKLHNMKMYF